MSDRPVTEVARPRLTRAQVEAGPLTRLPSATARVMALADELRWDSLSRGDTIAFAAQATISAELSQLCRA